jgi:antagonist of KipI
VNPVLRVVEPGLFTTIQDLGRLNAIASGVPPGGAMDRFAHQAANALVGNDGHDATLECTITGPSLIAEEPCLIAITGADLDLRINGAPAPAWTGTLLARGDRLTFGGRRSGARTYVAVRGGFDGERWLGSRSTSIMAGRGGMSGRALVAGDVLAAASERAGPVVAGRELGADVRPDYSDHKLAVLPGPHVKRLGADGRRALLSTTFVVGLASNRIGYRLEGPPLTTAGEELLSFGLVAGAVQVPHSGQPILLMADHQTAGGYPVVATVISASLPIAAQLAPGDEVRFVEVSATQARQRRVELSLALSSLDAP